MPDQPIYRGRFAPSPTGPLHLGSVFTALASYLQARSRKGKWLLRIDDLDMPRNIKGSVDNILRTLDTLGLHWDESVAFQSQSLYYYHEILNKLNDDKHIYPCRCSRKTQTARYTGFCRDNYFNLDIPHAYRVKTDDSVISFVDELQGIMTYPIAEQGDFILKRKDQVIAYQFAVVVDDHLQAVNHVVRACDLLDSTPRQLYLQRLLGFEPPVYMHVPVIIDEAGYKLSKQTQALPVDLNRSNDVIFGVLVLLKQNPPNWLQQATVTELLDWAVAHWNPMTLKNCKAINNEYLTCRLLEQ
ncbi:MAG: tRNA glutamyl-Q(34) synthetase GluQRS [Methylococcales bacterium]|nr:MAG: tRNA glutamyl-Q(34) synthetase GluQRS [Methylococcales bacterium]